MRVCVSACARVRVRVRVRVYGCVVLCCVVYMYVFGGGSGNGMDLDLCWPMRLGRWGCGWLCTVRFIILQHVLGMSSSGTVGVVGFHWWTERLMLSDGGDGGGGGGGGLNELVWLMVDGWWMIDVTDYDYLPGTYLGSPVLKYDWYSTLSARCSYHLLYYSIQHPYDLIRTGFNVIIWVDVNDSEWSGINPMWVWIRMNKDESMNDRLIGI